MGGALSSDTNLGGATTNGAIEDKVECPEGRYVGDWDDHKWHGHGKLTWNTGTTYEGEWRAGKRHGHGRMVWNSGAVYVGGFKDNKRFGNGTYTYTNGNKYEGGMKDDCQHGMGKYTHHQGHVYEGGYDMGQQSGRGKIVYHSGTIFEGQFKNSRIQYGLLRIATHEYVASFEEATPTTENVDPMSIVYNVQLSSQDGKYFKPLQFCAGDFLDTEAVVVMREDHTGTEQETRASLEFVPLPLPEEEGVEEDLVQRKLKRQHERPPPVSSEPARHQLENEDMEDDQ